jgi:transposase InsO family protein
MDGKTSVESRPSQSEKTFCQQNLGPWKSMAQVEWETLKWVDWYNNRRLLAPIGYRPPAEAERTFYADQSRLDLAA